MSSLPPSRVQSPGEERANSLSHALGFVLVAVALVVMSAWPAATAGAVGLRLAELVFVLSLALLFGASALCHALPPGPAKRLWDRVDRAAIYLFIAGSYTPFAVPALHGALAWALFMGVWAVALAGALSCLWQGAGHPLWSTLAYLALGWLVLVAALPWIAELRPLGRWLLVAGGLAYSLGALLFMASARLRFAHLGWHLMVMLGSGLHAAAVGLQRP